MSDNERRTSELLREDFLRLCASFRPALLIGGHSEESVDALLQNAQDELRAGQAHHYIQVTMNSFEIPPE